jgi:hypothetical protein
VAPTDRGILDRNNENIPLELHRLGACGDKTRARGMIHHNHRKNNLDSIPLELYGLGACGDKLVHKV